MEKRLDMLVCENLGVSREYAREVILQGKCFVLGKAVLKPGAKFCAGQEILVNTEKMPFVSRGGLKLAKALDVFQIDLTGANCLDIGASTGGFTDCMLLRGASKVIALDNGHGQLAAALNGNPRVIPMEGVDIREVKPQDLPFVPDFFALDLSFISIVKVMPAVSALTGPKSRGVLLVKPQFECGRGGVNKRGVVEDPKAHITAIEGICADLGDFEAAGICHSPIMGRRGNIEYLIFVEKHGQKAPAQVKNIVRTAYEILKGRKI